MSALSSLFFSWLNVNGGYFGGLALRFSYVIEMEVIVIKASKIVDRRVALKQINKYNTVSYIVFIFFLYRIQL